MQLNSFDFILYFMPLSLLGYFGLNRFSYKAGRVFLILASALFYSAAGLKCSLILLLSLLFNFLLSRHINRKQGSAGALLALGIGFNVALLFIFKYYNFFAASLSPIFARDLTFKNIFLPLGISFFSFQQISWLLDSREQGRDYTLSEYALYILFFPKLIMGPLIEPEPFIAQLRREDNKKLSFDNLCLGLRMFNLGLIKKLLLADTFAKAVNWGFQDVSVLTSYDTLFVMLCYTFQIYFDFSGYSDMAIGSAKMLNIELPRNFNSPYKALSVGDFWKRWHMSLTAFFTRHLYIPMGGSREGKLRGYRNILIVFAVSGIWHGANWTFILWGVLYGVLLVIDKIIKPKYERIPKFLRWCIAFGIINVLWLLFRAESVSQWLFMLGNMFSLKSRIFSLGLTDNFYPPLISDITDMFPALYNVPEFGLFVFIALAFLICLAFKNTQERSYKMNLLSVAGQLVIIVYCLISLHVEAPFVYFGF